MIWAHYEKDSGLGQTLEEHLKHVEEEMEKGLETVSFSETVIDPNDIKNTGCFHDIGKITSYFQKYLTTGKITPEKNHALISAALYAGYYEAVKKEFPLLSVAAITCHHINLSLELPKGSAMDCLDKQYKNCMQQAKGDIFETKVSFGKFCGEDLRTYWRRTLKAIRKKENPEYFFALQLLFSKLISADKRDSAGILDYGKDAFRGDVDTYLARKMNGKNAAVNSDRQRIRESVINRIQMLDEEQLKNQRIFTLTAPTGTGKTLTSVTAAILLAERLEQINGERPHIITAVPFLNILEQTIEDYKGIFGDVLVHSSAASPFEQDVGRKRENQNNGENEELMPLQKRMLLTSSWSAPVVLTTFVQLFESFLSGENNRLLKVNRLVNAIVILDEIQALEAEKYPLYAVVLDMMAKCYGTQFILMTATQPKLFDCAKVYSYIPAGCMELLPEYKQYFAKLKRTKIYSLMSQVRSLDQLCDYIEENQLFRKNILIVVNKIADSIELYQSLRDRGFYAMYLSTNLTGRDRKRVIEDARNRLADKDAEPFIMVSTQTIEAGVDLDFDLAFRDLAPMESIIQVAGRVNRSGNKGDFCPVYLFDTGHANQIYSSMAVRTTKKLLIDKEVPESEYQKLVEAYYDILLNEEFVSFDWEIYQEGILKLDYEKINEFKMIRDGDRYSVIFIQDEKAEDLTGQLCELICKEESSFEDKAMIQQCFNQLGQYTVDIFAGKLKKNLPTSFADYSKDICGKKIQLNYFVVARDDLDRYYNETGFIAEEADLFMF